MVVGWRDRLVPTKSSQAQLFHLFPASRILSAPLFPALQKPRLSAEGGSLISTSCRIVPYRYHTYVCRYTYRYRIVMILAITLPFGGSPRPMGGRDSGPSLSFYFHSHFHLLITVTTFPFYFSISRQTHSYPTNRKFPHLLNYPFP